MRQVKDALDHLVRIDPRWSEARLLEHVRQQFVTLRRAYATGDLATIKRLVHPDLYAECAREIEAWRARQGRPDVAKVTVTQAVIVEISSQIGQAREAFTIRMDGVIVDGRGGRTSTREFWTVVWSDDEWRPREIARAVGWRRFFLRAPTQATVPSTLSDPRPLSPEVKKLMMIPVVGAVLFMTIGVFAMVWWQPIGAWSVACKLLGLGAPLVPLVVSLVERKFNLRSLPKVQLWNARAYLSVGFLSAWLTLITGANALFDRSTPESTVAPIVGRHVTHNKNQVRYFVNYRLRDGIESAVVTHDQFNHAMDGHNTVVVRTAPGFLSIPWIVSETYVPGAAKEVDVTEALAWTKTFDAAREITGPAASEYRHENWPNGAIKSEEPIVNGVIHGIGVYHFANGQLYGKIPYRHGQKHGWFDLRREDGSLEQTLSYRDGRPHGLSKWYDNAGRVTKQWVYVNGEPVKEL